MTRKILEDALNEYNGTILFTSHDRYFINKVANKIIAIEDKKLIKYIGNYTDYKECLKNKIFIIKTIRDILVLVISIETLKTWRENMKIDEIKNIQDILEYMKNNIEYGYIDVYGNKHIKELKGFRPIYRTSSIENTIQNKVGTCIEQVALMNYLCNMINIKSKMYCTRIYEPNDFNNPDAEEHMHCFLLAFQDGKVFHIEHPNHYNVGIFEYETIDKAIEEIQNYFKNLSGGVNRPLAEFYHVEEGKTFQEFNNYINSLNQII